MQKTQKQTDDRADRRYMVREGVFIAIPGKPQQCAMLDISMSGVAFQCRYKGEIPCNVDRVDIVVDGDVVLSGMPYNNVSDCCRVDSNYQPIRRRSGRFENLEPHQQNGLRNLIDQYAE